MLIDVSVSALRARHARHDDERRVSGRIVDECPAHDASALAASTTAASAVPVRPARSVRCAVTSCSTNPHAITTRSASRAARHAPCALGALEHDTACGRCCCCCAFTRATPYVTAIIIIVVIIVIIIIVVVMHSVPCAKRDAIGTRAKPQHNTLARRSRDVVVRWPDHIVHSTSTVVVGNINIPLGISTAGATNKERAHIECARRGSAAAQHSHAARTLCGASCARVRMRVRRVRVLPRRRHWQAAAATRHDVDVNLTKSATRNASVLCASAAAVPTPKPTAIPTAITVCTLHSSNTIYTLHSSRLLKRTRRVARTRTRTTPQRERATQCRVVHSPAPLVRLLRQRLRQRQPCAAPSSTNAHNVPRCARNATRPIAPHRECKRDTDTNAHTVAHSACTHECNNNAPTPITHSITALRISTIATIGINTSRRPKRRNTYNNQLCWHTRARACA
jgi:hypothetical protein